MKCFLLTVPASGSLLWSSRSKRRSKWIFFHWLPVREGFVPQSPKSCTRKSEEATRQQGGLFFRENSSNGGKAIRTFWRNTKFGKIPCQGQNFPLVSLWSGDSYRGYSRGKIVLRLR